MQRANNIIDDLDDLVVDRKYVVFYTKPGGTSTKDLVYKGRFGEAYKWYYPETNTTFILDYANLQQVSKKAKSRKSRRSRRRTRRARKTRRNRR
jgi:hypothetical protein